MTIRLADVEPSPDVFAAVMATGILSIGAHDHGYRLIIDAMGVIARCSSGMRWPPGSLWSSQGCYWWRGRCC
ncbi:hypothetical protein B8W69_05620 [Mycobacterium vulneris]|uniref:Uncharacterized protein n=1 Tax=Mycolicibacterium vulneris TaxID=547163 RepID=A0A1X2LCT9_9MYCO|nr:hypothetical protein [Mycolicibacterium vulneris]OSC31313.1 hypothetical protein B8W69_05620 [Mycolicibacterium vulneris]